MSEDKTKNTKEISKEEIQDLKDKAKELEMIKRTGKVVKNYRRIPDEKDKKVYEKDMIIINQGYSEKLDRMTAEIFGKVKKILQKGEVVLTVGLIEKTVDLSKYFLDRIKVFEGFRKLYFSGGKK